MEFVVGITSDRVLFADWVSIRQITGSKGFAARALLLLERRLPGNW